MRSRRAPRGSGWGVELSRDATCPRRRRRSMMGRTGPSPWWRAAALVATLAVALIGCTGGPATSATPAASSAASAAAGGKVLKIGIEGPFTGPSARTGQEFRGSVELAFDKIHYQVGPYQIQ